VSFLEVILENPFLPVYLITVAVALWRYPRYFETPLRYFPILLMYTLVTELWGVLIKYYDQFDLFLNEFFQNYNWLLYNVYTVISYFYFYYIFWCYVQNENHKKIITVGAIAFVLTSIVNLFINSFLLEPQVFAYIIGALVLVIAAFLYFLNLRTKFQTWFLKNDLVSWIGAGILIFYTGIIPIHITKYYNARYGLNDASYIHTMLLLLIFGMYLCFIIGFLRMERSNRDLVRPLK